MNRIRGAAILLAACVFLGTGTTLFGQAASQVRADVPNTLVTYAENVLARVATRPSVVRFVEAQNARWVSVSTLKARDEQWQKSTTVESYMWDLLRNDLAWELVSFQFQNKFIVEAFAMDNRGAIVAETNRTSSYYKGEVPKFTAAYAKGAGAIWYGPVAYDDRSAEMVIQVSVPIMKGGRAIGVICFGVSLDRWEER